MWDLLSKPTAQAIISVIVLMVVVFVAVKVVTRMRGLTRGSDISDNDLAENFEEMLAEGEIDEAELRKIRAVIGKTQDPSSESK